jgi:virginiamycin B lyase
MWIVLGDTSQIVRVTTSGSVGTPISTPTAAANPMTIVLGPDGALWFTENSAGKLGRVTTAGFVSEFPLGTGVAPAGLLVGVDNNLYFGDTNKHIGQFVINTSKVTLFPSSGDATNLALGPDFEVYFTEPGANKMGQFLYF